MNPLDFLETEDTLTDFVNAVELGTWPKSAVLPT